MCTSTQGRDLHSAAKPNAALGSCRVGKRVAKMAGFVLSMGPGDQLPPGQESSQQIKGSGQRNVGLQTQVCSRAQKMEFRYFFVAEDDATLFKARNLFGLERARKKSSQASRSVFRPGTFF